jgi:hypothetical protein
VGILPVILSASRFARNPARFQAVNPPDRPLNEIPQAEQEKVLDRLAHTIEGSVRSRGSLPRAPPADRFSGPRFE